MDSESNSRLLVDKAKSGKERPWTRKKLSSINYYELLHILEFKKAERVKECGTVLEFKADVDLGYLKLYKAWFCKSRLCSLCNWRRAMKHSVQTRRIVTEVMKRRPAARWLFLTLTIKNVYDGEELKQSLTEMGRGFNRLMKYKKVKRNMIGFMRATEVTVNDIDNSYNQHMHVLVCIGTTYFSNTENYITHKQWVALWRKAMKLDYDPIVNVKAVKAKDKHETDAESAVAETAKYPVKDTDYMTDEQEKNLKRVADLEEGLFKKRLISYGGLLKEIHAELNLDDVEDGDLIRTGDEADEVEETAYKVIALWNWQRKNYFIKG